MTKIIITSRYEPKGLTAEVTAFDNVDGCAENVAMEFARAMARHGYYVTITTEVAVFDARRSA